MASNRSKPQPPERLKFKVASHIVEDLGLNLYTSLPRVLVEFVANAYDADSPWVKIDLDPTSIEQQRRVVRAGFALERAQAPDEEPEVPLAMRVLDESVRIEITDAGIGMSRDDLQHKFLVAGRRRRAKGETMTEQGRAVMGRKGLGKLAGFGVAKRVTIITRTEDAERPTKIVLDYDELVRDQLTDGYDVPEEEISPDDFPEHGTKVILDRLLFEPMRSRETTIEHEIADHFALIDQRDFAIHVNNKKVKPTPRKHVYSWPDPERPLTDLVTKRLDLSDEQQGTQIEFKYRLRFTDDSLRAAHRGVRVYANKRLAAAPSLLDAETGMHGFRMSDYLDGVVHADFIDAQPVDYIATDRHGLRWESPMLSELRVFLSEEIKEACKQYQRKRDENKDKEVKEDPFTKNQIKNSGLVASERKVALLVAKTLGRALEDGVEDQTYKTTLPALVQAIGHGSILSAIAKLAEEKNPEFSSLVAEITRLTKGEIENFTRHAKARLKAIGALKRVVEAANFRAAQNEKELQKLFEQSPWLIDPTYTQFLSADTRSDSLYVRLAQELKIAKHAPPKVDADKRPDLVFLIGNSKLGRLVIVELKSANKPLNNDHLTQLEYYMQQAEEWLAEHDHADMKVEGHLIGTKASPAARSEGIKLLNRRIKKAGPTEPWRVRDYLDVLQDTEAAHQELIEMQSGVEFPQKSGHQFYAASSTFAVCSASYSIGLM